jgi:hypothetical protein
MKLFFRKNDFPKNIFRCLVRTKKSPTTNNGIQQLLPESGDGRQITARTPGIWQVWPESVRRNPTTAAGRRQIPAATLLLESGECCRIPAIGY